jgi:hypothetical protein
MRRGARNPDLGSLAPASRLLNKNFRSSASLRLFLVIPAKAGIQANSRAKSWIPAFAGMTVEGDSLTSDRNSGGIGPSAKTWAVECIGGHGEEETSGSSFSATR